MIINKKKKICVLNPSYENSNSIFAQYDSEYCDPALYFKDEEYLFDYVMIKKATASQQIRDLSKMDYYLFLNLCDGAPDEDRAGREVVELLEQYNLAFTGANSKNFDSKKETQKKLAHYYGVKTPQFGFAYTKEESEEVIEYLKYPVIVKHFNGYGSIGMTSNSKCENIDQFRVEVERVLNLFGGVLIEEFIEGREFNVLVSENAEEENEPIAYDPLESVYVSHTKFQHFDVKWVTEEHLIDWGGCNDPILSDKLKEMSKKMFLALGGVGYGRTDIRVDEKGEAYFLEINPNCSLFYRPEDEGRTDWILTHDSKHNHTDFIYNMFKCAIKRQKMRMKKTKVRYFPTKGYGTYSTLKIKEGELIHKHEEKSHFLVSKDYVKKEWKDALLLKWFDEYSYPFSENVFCIWSDDPEEWLPVNHSCDPNCWLEGLDVVARREIKKGEEIEMDYSTFCGEGMKEFECDCKSKDCRKMIKGTDYLLTSLQLKYKNHFSDFLRTSKLI
eukprot:TRINITY_DN6031_c0_g1_i1.p1 TRINITY_DN6031_c0_g1~~TRINITY_DN6031_c0_g1_i1.p1  ORF type:complete len:500 (-),score=151.00 TRINITY_DN6031_c0_g1_i1:197-1696(-)